MKAEDSSMGHYQVNEHVGNRLSCSAMCFIRDNLLLQRFMNRKPSVKLLVWQNCWQFSRHETLVQVQLVPCTRKPCLHISGCQGP
jgi:hypothetical protein